MSSAGSPLNDPRRSLLNFKKLLAAHPSAVADTADSTRPGASVAAVTFDSEAEVPGGPSEIKLARGRKILPGPLALLHGHQIGRSDTLSLVDFVATSVRAGREDVD